MQGRFRGHTSYQQLPKKRKNQSPETEVATQSPKKRKNQEEIGSSNCQVWSSSMDSASGWECLPCHLLDSILDKVETRKDYLQFDVVCGLWHSVAMTRKQRSRINILPQVPMLLVPSEEANNHSHALYNVVTRTFSKSKLFVPYGKRFASFSLGWLFAVEQDFSVTLHKAINTSTIIRLPPLFPLKRIPKTKYYFDYHVLKGVISADPLTNPNECVVAVIFGSCNWIAFIRPYKDTSWTCVSEELFGADDILYHNDHFYALLNDGTLFSFKVRDDPFNYSNDVKLVAFKIRGNIYGKPYLVESQGKLLLVVRDLEWPKLKDPTLVTRETLKVNIYNVDFVKRKWVRVRSIGENALFLGDNISISVSCLNFFECKSNCIYFTHDIDCMYSSPMPLIDFGEYDLQSGTMTLHFGIDAKKISKRVPIWVVPCAQ